MRPRKTADWQGPEPIPANSAQVTFTLHFWLNWSINDQMAGRDAKGQGKYLFSLSKPHSTQFFYEHDMVTYKINTLKKTNGSQYLS